MNSFKDIFKLFWDNLHSSEDIFNSFEDIFKYYISIIHSKIASFQDRCR